ncbi:MAG: ABC transporter permease subunit, partial [Candidatus Eremiobacterota bacterium]
MIRSVAAHQLRLLWRDGSLRWGGGLLLLLMLLSLGLGWQNLAAARSEIEQARSGERRRWLEQGSKNPHSAAHWGVYAFRPRLAPAAIDPGLDPYLGVAVWVEAHKQNAAMFRPADDSTGLARWARLTPAFVLQKLVPLGLILFAFGAVAGERERGTLRQVLALGVNGRILLLGKAVGIATALTLLLSPAGL